MNSKHELCAVLLMNDLSLSRPNCFFPLSFIMVVLVSIYKYCTTNIDMWKFAYIPNRLGVVKRQIWRYSVDETVIKMVIITKNSTTLYINVTYSKLWPSFWLMTDQRIVSNFIVLRHLLLDTIDHIKNIFSNKLILNQCQ